MSYQTEQEGFWAGEFGDEYAGRNASPELLAGNLAFFSKVLRRCSKIDSVIEFGANIGMNLKALASLLPKAELHAVEINEKAVRELEKLDRVTPYQASLLDFSTNRTFDLAMIKGVLIHIHPDELHKAYDLLEKSSRRFVLIAEYYNPTPVAVPYRGHSDRLFKRDFAGEFMDRHPNMKLVDYGFCYRRDPVFPMDDVSWFLMEKQDGE